jgi:ribonuclease HI
LFPIVHEWLAVHEIYTNGGCEPNPGLGGFGAVLIHPSKRAEVSGSFRKTTNNRMEIFAANAALELLKQPCKGIGFAWHRSLRGSSAKSKVPP